MFPVLIKTSDEYKDPFSFFIRCWPSKFQAVLSSEDPFDLRDLVSFYAYELLQLHWKATDSGVVSH